ncbi:uncharacterized protein [Lolium perenne]|uniref:uncharacterized protein n=1 Tax=Lolium perenne TaxID=4522 RepID=UPI0021F5F1E6|nr:uncharacterized protein LOC127348108 [Lolium perenne]
MEFKVTVTTRAATMEKWIYRVSEDFLCDASAKIVGLDCEFTDKVKGIKQKLLPEDKRQRAAVLQLCVANDIILFSDISGNKGSMFVKEILELGEDLKMINIHKLDPGVKNKRIPSLYDLSNAVLGTNLEKKVLVL